jgi:hypothetical protein
VNGWIRIVGEKMRRKEEILKEYDEKMVYTEARLILEVLIDIRDGMKK